MNYLKLLTFPLVLGALLAFTADTAFAKMERPWGTGVTVSIGVNGNVLVRGAEVTDVDENDLTAKTAWGSHELVWTVNTDGTTTYIDVFGGNATTSLIDVGDIISFSGPLSGSLTVDADTIRIWSDEGKRATISGKVTDVDGDSFIVAWGNRTVTVDVDSDTDFRIGKDDASFSDIDVGDRVKVTGLYSSDQKTLDASLVIMGAVSGDEDDDHDEEDDHDDYKKHPWRPFINFWNGFKFGHN